MRVKAVKAKNYRTLENFQTEFASDYSTLSGHNNAGKSAIIRLLVLLFQHMPRPGPDPGLDYVDDRTQWVKNNPAIHISYALSLSRKNDHSLISFIEKFSKRQMGDDVELNVSVTVGQQDKVKWSMSIGAGSIADTDAAEILTKLRSSNAMFLHNAPHEVSEYFFLRGQTCKCVPRSSLHRGV